MAKNIVFSAGSLGGLTFFGAWSALEEAGMTSGITGFSGCSMGSVVALLTSLGYTGKELARVASALRYNDFRDLQISQLLDNYGLETGKKMQRLISALIRFKTGRGDLTFREHYDLTGKTLWINASCVEEDRCYYFSKDTAPDMSITKATRMSISIPLVMAVVRHEGRTFIDGGFHDPSPVAMFPVEDTLLLRVHNNSNIGVSSGNMLSYLGLIISSIKKRLYVHLTERDRYQTININSGIGSLTIEAKRAVRKRLVETGYQTTKTWLRANPRVA
jgi:predicted acylesterase/phospholipase RssA